MFQLKVLRMPTNVSTEEWDLDLAYRELKNWTNLIDETWIQYIITIGSYFYSFLTIYLCIIFNV